MRSGLAPPSWIWANTVDCNRSEVMTTAIHTTTLRTPAESSERPRLGAAAWARSARGRALATATAGAARRQAGGGFRRGCAHRLRSRDHLDELQRREVDDR